MEEMLTRRQENISLFNAPESLGILSLFSPIMSLSEDLSSRVHLRAVVVPNIQA